MNISVTLDSNANPPLTVTPDDDSVSADAHVVITWTRSSSSQPFDFSEISGLPDGPFSGLNLTRGGISVNDNNTGIFGNRDYPYALTVTAPDGTRYTANAQNGNPRIHNN